MRCRAMNIIHMFRVITDKLHLFAPPGMWSLHVLSVMQGFPLITPASSPTPKACAVGGLASLCFL